MSSKSLTKYLRTLAGSLTLLSKRIPRSSWLRRPSKWRLRRASFTLVRCWSKTFISSAFNPGTTACCWGDRPTACLEDKSHLTASKTLSISFRSYSSRPLRVKLAETPASSTRWPIRVIVPSSPILTASTRSRATNSSTFIMTDSEKAIFWPKPMRATSSFSLLLNIFSIWPIHAVWIFSVSSRPTSAALGEI